MSLKEKFSRYKLVEWITLVLGLIICVIQIYQYAFNQLGEPIVEVGVSIVWLLLIIAPKSIIDIIRKIKGLSNGRNDG